MDIILLSEAVWTEPERLCRKAFRLFSGHSHSLRLNALCVIYVYLIPSGDSDSLRHSYSTACTASGYHFVISAITGETVLL